MGNGGVTSRHGHADIHLQNRNASVILRGNRNRVHGRDGNVQVSGRRTSHNKIVLGNGTDEVGLGGRHNTINHNKITLGSGNDHVFLGAHSNHDTVKVGHGHDVITTVAGDDHNTFKLDASTTSLFLHGSHNAVFINGGNDVIVDTPGDVTVDTPGPGDHLTLHMGALGGAELLYQVARWATHRGRFPNRRKRDSTWQTEEVCHGCRDRVARRLRRPAPEGAGEAVG